MKNYFWYVTIACWFLAGCGTSAPTAPSMANFGRFEGEVVASWNNDGRNMTLRQPFAYIDSQNRRWLAPEGAVVNGASIPSAFWSIIGGPFEGQYRNASVIHDVGCHEMTASWQDVHRTFYEACRCGGVEESRAKIMYYAVYHFGPRWETVYEPKVETFTTPDGRLAQREVATPTVVRIDPPPPTPEEVEQATALIVEENPNPEVIEQTNREVLRRRPRSGGYGKKPAGRPDGFNTAARPDDGQPIRQGASRTPGWNGDRPASGGPDHFAADSPPSPAAPRQRNGSGARNPRSEMPGNEQSRFPDGQRPALSPQEVAWAENVVRQHLEQQSGEQRPAEYSVERTERGYRVQVQYLQLNEQGQPAGYTGGSTLRLGRDGRVLEMINR